MRGLNARIWLSMHRRFTDPRPGAAQPGGGGVSGGAILLMAFIGLAAMAMGATLLLGAGRRAGEAARYAARLAGVMVSAIGLILIVFAATWTGSPRPAG